MGWVPRKKSLVLRKPEKLRFTEQSYPSLALASYPLSTPSVTPPHLLGSILAFGQPHFLIPCSVTHLQKDSVTDKDGFGERNLVVLLKQERLEHSFRALHRSSHSHQGMFGADLALKQLMGHPWFKRPYFSEFGQTICPTPCPLTMYQLFQISI